MRPADVRNGPMLHQELHAWGRGRTNGDYVASSMAGYLASTGRMSNIDAARIGRGRLTEVEQDRLFTQAAYGHPLRRQREPSGPAYLQQIGAMRQWAAGRMPNQPIDTSRSDWLEESLTGEQGMLRSELTEPSLGNGGL